MSLYLKILIFAGAVPFILSFYPPLKFYRRPLALLASIGSVLIVFGLWDILATLNQHWYFVAKGIYGIYFLALPLEEWLFFIVITFCCLFTWEVIKYFWKE
jgi:lycopene cyclase domain-containing protein